MTTNTQNERERNDEPKAQNCADCLGKGKYLIKGMHHGPFICKTCNGTGFDPDAESEQ